MALIIRTSALHGVGVYTTAPIATSTRVLEYTGERIRADSTDGMYDDVTYLFGLDGGKTVIDGFGMAAFVNHSCDANCETDQIDGKIWIISTRDIQAGEELSYDYNIYDTDPGEEVPCHCGAANCRGTMISEDELKRHRKLARKKTKLNDRRKSRRK